MLRGRTGCWLAILGILWLARPVPAQGTEAGAEYQAARRELFSRTGGRLEELAAWCQGERLYLERDRCYQALLLLEPDHAGARRFLRYRRTKDGWLQQDYRAPRNHAEEELDEAARRRGELEATFRAELVLLAERHGIGRDRLLTDVLLVCPDDREAHLGRGEVKEGERWVLLETAAARERRAELEARAKELARAPVEILADSPGENAIREALPWKNTLRSEHMHVRSCGERAEGEAHLRAGESAVALFAEIFDTAPALPRGTTIYVLDCPRTRAEFLERCHDGALGLLEQGYSRAWTTDRTALAVAAEERDVRLDHTVRQTVQRQLAEAFGLGPELAWAYEGFGLALAELATGRSDVVRNAGVLAGRWSWGNEDTLLAAARARVCSGEALELETFFSRELASFTREDVLVAYALARYLMEGCGDEVTRILEACCFRRQPAAQVFRQELGYDARELEARLVRWFREMEQAPPRDPRPL